VNLPTGYAAALNQGIPVEDAIGLERRRYRYDANGRLGFQKTHKSDGTTLKHDIDYEGVGVNGQALGYDAAGNVIGYGLKNYDGTDYTNTTSITLARYVEKQRGTVSTLYQTGTSTSTFDVNGNLVAIDDATENTLDRSIANDASGRALRVMMNEALLARCVFRGSRPQAACWSPLLEGARWSRVLSAAELL
jgi:hypothetical protein